MSTVKREPLLADLFLAKGPGHPGIDPQFLATTRDNLLLAKRFVLDKQATIYCADLVRRAPRIIADAQDFAIPPFDRTYIEFPLIPWYETIMQQPSSEYADQRVGYLIIGSIVRVIVQGFLQMDRAGLLRGASQIGIMPLQYHLNHPWKLEDELAFVKRLRTSRAMLDSLFWGHSIVTLAQDEWNAEAIRSLRANHSMSLHMSKEIDEGKVSEAWPAMYHGCSGDLRNIIALLLFLNRTSKVRYEREVGSQAKLIARKPVMLLKHRVITLHINPTTMLMKLAAGEGIRRRLHDVRGHLCHNKVARENHHDHEWQETELYHDNHPQWKCACGGLRWWRREHKRGHEDKGRVTASYSVTK